MSSLVKTALVGLGKIGIGYDFKDGIYQGTAKSHWGAIQKHADVEIVNLIDVAPTHTLYSKNAISERYCDLETFCSERREYDLLILAVPTKTHLEVLRQIIDKHYFRFIILEKPCGANLSECCSIIDTLEEKSIKWQVNYFRSALPNTLVSLDLMTHLKEVPISAEIYGYGDTLNIFSHFLHLFTKFVPNESLEIADCDLTFGIPTITFRSGLELSVRNIGGPWQDEPILCLVFPNYILRFQGNGEEIEIMRRQDGRIYDVLRSPDFENYQEVATREFLQRFRSGLSDNRLKIQKVHELVSRLDSLHG
jgi:hypothetical protein